MYSLNDKWVFQLGVQELAVELYRELCAHGYNKITSGKEFMYASGRIPILLIAHVDTVHRELPKDLFYDEAQGVLWSPQGVGADDRAGVLAILEILRRGYKPHILFTDGEEVGCTGVREAVNKLKDPGIRYVVELDRTGFGEAVFYDCENPVFTQYVLDFGFKEHFGTFTDITTLCPRWKVAGVNLSCGYYEAHTTREYLRIPELKYTVDCLEKMLQNPPKKRFRYMYAKTVSVAYGYNWWDRDNFNTDWRSLYGGGSGTSTARFGTAADEFLMYVDAFELATMYGGSTSYWDNWLEEHHSELLKRTEESLWNLVDIYATGGATCPEEVEEGSVSPV